MSSRPMCPHPRIGWASMVGDTETGLVYVHTVSGLFPLYTPDGEVVWERSLHEEFGQISGYGGRFHTPLIDEDRIIVSFLQQNWGETGGPPRHAYYAFDKRTGQVRWVSIPGGRPEDTTYSSPDRHGDRRRPDADRWQWRRWDLRDPRPDGRTAVGLPNVSPRLERRAGRRWQSGLYLARRG
jgi:hypothetical protein